MKKQFRFNDLWGFADYLYDNLYQLSGYNELGWHEIYSTLDDFEYDFNHDLNKTVFIKENIGMKPFLANYIYKRLNDLSEVDFKGTQEDILRIINNCGKAI